MKKVLFICLGNICRSPMAEGIFKKMIRDNNLDNEIMADSAGTSNYHIGDDPDERMQETAMRHEIKLNHKARQLTSSDFQHFDYFVAMDSSNLEDINLIASKTNIKPEILMMRDFDNNSDSINVPDPWYGGEDGFEKVYNILFRSCKKFIEYLKTQHKL